jgi:hypothetical protein
MAGYIGSKASVVSSGAEHKKLFNITTTTTSLTGLVYTPTLVHVFHNGVRLVDGTDYTATTGTSITLTVAAENGDQVVVISYATFQTSDTVSASAGGTFGNSVTMSSGAVVNRTGDGTIIDLQSGGTTVGSIDVDSGDNISFGATTGGGSGLHMFGAAGTSPFILPMKEGALSDNTVTLGDDARRFKDLYLSGGVYLGGTGAANHLDDYEEGTFTLTLGGVASGAFGLGKYVKVGRLVHFQWYSGGTFTAGAGTASFNGLPFITAPSSYYSVFSAFHNSYCDTASGGYLDTNASSGVFINLGSVSAASTTVASGRYLMVAGTYYTDQ